MAKITVKVYTTGSGLLYSFCSHLKLNEETYTKDNFVLKRTLNTKRVTRNAEEMLPDLKLLVSLGKYRYIDQELYLCGDCIKAHLRLPRKA